jgi:hypothetical protein
MPSDHGEEEPSRRAFLIRYAGAAFAAPVIASFALEGVAHANQTTGNQPPPPPNQGNQGNQGGNQGGNPGNP